MPALRPPPRLLPHRAWTRARAELLRHAGQPGLIALLGAAGVGKTALLGALEAQLREAGQAPQRVECGDLVTTPLPPLLLVDEADRLDEAMLAELAGTDGVAVLAALPGFAARIQGLPHRLVRLDGLQEEEVPAYVAARLAALHLPAERVEASALEELAGASAGVPRRLNVLLGSSLFLAEMDGAPQLRAAHVRSAQAMHALPDPEPDPEPDPVPPTAPEAGQALMLRPADPALPLPPPGLRRRTGWIAAGLVGVAGAVLAVLAPPPGPEAEPAPPPTEQAAPTVQESPPPLLRPALAEPAQMAPPPVVPARQPPPGPPLPQHPTPRIVLTYPRGDAAAAARGSALEVRLRQLPVSVAAPFPVSGGAEEEVLRYFFPQDREAALALAAAAEEVAAPTGLGTVPPGAPLPRPGTLEWAISTRPAAAAADRAAPDGAAAGAPTLPVPLPVPVPSLPPDGAILPATAWPLPVELAWRGTDAEACCFLEVLGLAPEGWQTVFAGYAEAADRHTVPMTAPRPYAWRVLHVSRDGPRYAPGPWRRFTVEETTP